MARSGWDVVLIVVAMSLQETGQASIPLLQADQSAAAVCGEKGFAVMLGDYLDAEGVVLWPGAQLAIGRQDALLLFPDLRAVPPLRWQALGAILAHDSSVGVTWGVAVELSHSQGLRTVFRRYVAAWRHSADRWNLAAFALTGPRTGGEVQTLFAVRRQPDLDAGRPFTPFVEADRAFASLAADSGAAVAFGRWASFDATMFRGDGILIRGPYDIGALVDGPAAWQWSPLAAGSSAAGDLGWTAGEAVISTSPENMYYSKYLTIWRKAPGGEVRFVVDAGNARPVPPPEGPR
jgi:hypothetical protein